MHKLTVRQKQTRQEWITGKVDLTFKQDVHTTQFEQLLKRLGLTEESCHLNPECAMWCRANRDRRYIPEIVLHRLRTKCLYEETDAPFSLVDNMVIPDTAAEYLTEVEGEHLSYQNAA